MAETRVLVLRFDWRNGEPSKRECAGTDCWRDTHRRMPCDAATLLRAIRKFSLEPTDGLGPRSRC